MADIQVTATGDVDMAPPSPIPYPQESSAPATPLVATPSCARVLPPPCPHQHPHPATPAMSGGVSTLLRGLEQGFDVLIVQPVKSFIPPALPTRNAFAL